MKISEKLKAKSVAIVDEGLAKKLSGNPNFPTPISDEVQTKAIAAVIGGNSSPDWETYMRIFTADEAELNRLVPLPLNSDNDAARKKARAYLVSNGVCGIATTGQLLNEVTTTLDL